MCIRDSFLYVFNTLLKNIQLKRLEMCKRDRVMSSVSYDEFNNGLSYLMTLPTTKKDYVREKYLFGFLLSGMTWSLTTVLLMIFNLVKDAPFDLYEWMLSLSLIHI